MHNKLIEKRKKYLESVKDKILEDVTKAIDEGKNIDSINEMLKEKYNFEMELRNFRGIYAYIYNDDSRIKFTAGMKNVRIKENFIDNKKDFTFVYQSEFVNNKGQFIQNEDMVEINEISFKSYSDVMYKDVFENYPSVKEHYYRNKEMKKKVIEEKSKDIEKNLLEIVENNEMENHKEKLKVYSEKRNICVDFGGLRKDKIWFVIRDNELNDYFSLKIDTEKFSEKGLTNISKTFSFRFIDQLDQSKKIEEIDLYDQVVVTDNGVYYHFTISQYKNSPMKPFLDANVKKEYKEDIRRIIRKEINDYCRKMIQHDIENIEVKEGFYEKEIRRSGLDGVSRVIDTKTIKDNFYLVTLKNGEQLSINEDHLESYDDFKDLDLTNKEGWRRFIRNRIDQGLKMFSVEEDKLKVFVYPSEEKFLESKNKMISDVIKEYKKEKQLGLNK